MARVKDLAKYPELRWLDRLQWLPPSCLVVFCYVIADWSGLVWGFLVGTVLLYHATFLVNSVCHVVGTRRYSTTDGSRNNVLVALLTMGEGWHNNHHHYPRSAKQGFRWWEIDTSYYALCILALFGLVWDLRRPPANKLITKAMGTELNLKEAALNSVD
jgi:stearoyl-CoA desaturase (Delta-9 desaturase)